MAAATITKSSSAPDGQVSLSAGDVTFTLNDQSKSYETDDPQVISAAQGSATFDVELAPVEESESGFAALDTDPNDPRLHRNADHLSANASQETLDAAAKNEEAIQAVAVAADSQAVTAGAPTVQQALEQQFAVTLADTAPVVPYETPGHEPVASVQEERPEASPATGITSAPSSDSSDAVAAGDTSSSSKSSSADTTSTGASS